MAMLLWPGLIVLITTLSDICHTEIGLLLSSPEGSGGGIRAAELQLTEIVLRGDLE